MKKVTSTLLLKSLFILASLCSSPLIHAQADNFNYSTTVGLILKTEEGGHILQRPDYAESRNYFIATCEINNPVQIPGKEQQQYARGKPEVNTNENKEKVFITPHPAITPKASDNVIQHEATIDTNSKKWLWVVLLAIVFLVGYGQRRYLK